jgi:hypothetical protein
MQEIIGFFKNVSRWVKEYQTECKTINGYAITLGKFLQGQRNNLQTFLDQAQEILRVFNEEMDHSDFFTNPDILYNKLNKIVGMIYDKLVGGEICKADRYNDTSFHFFEWISMVSNGLNISVEKFKNMFNDISGEMTKIQDLVMKSKDALDVFSGLDVTRIFEASGIMDFANEFKKDLVDNVKPIVKSIMNEIESAGGEVLNYSIQAVNGAKRIIEPIFPMDGEVASKFVKLLVDQFKNESWRVRERVMMNLYLISGMGNGGTTISPRILKHVEEQILQRKVKETHTEIKLLINHRQYAQEMIDILKNNWDNANDKIKETISTQMEKINTLRAKVPEQQNKEVRAILVVKIEEEQRIIDDVLSNLTGVETIANVTINFLSDMRRQLFQMENLLLELKEEILEIKADVKLLVGKSTPELLEYKYYEISH